MNDITPGAAPTPTDNLHAELRSLIASSRQRLAGAVNAELTRLYWSVGKRLHTEVLGGADRAKYGDQLIKRMGDQLAQEFGRGFEAKNLRRITVCPSLRQARDCRDAVTTIELELLCQPATHQNRAGTPVLRRPSRKPNQIGRASCRERV